MPPKPKTKTAGAGAPNAAPRPFRLPVSGLEVGLLDVGRFVALNGYAHECRLLPFLSRSFRREEDFLVACKHVRYGGKQRTRLMSLAGGGDVDRVTLLLKVGADVEARERGRLSPASALLPKGLTHRLPPDRRSCPCPSARPPGPPHHFSGAPTPPTSAAAK
jgi:hypothetical protein